METTSSGQSTRPPLPTRRPTKRLLFDRRYGWVFDEWKDPSEEALAGGRGMFCILPIAKSMLNVASLSSMANIKELSTWNILTTVILVNKYRQISLAADFVIKALKSPIQLSRQELHANLCSQFHKLALNMQGWNLKLITLGNRRQNAMNSEEVPTN
ncbi:uncharacterized protein LOC135676479 isoform X1 [Musa acuminata AAA Group]|uniref:uncharacterized protein LOC135676479 isoform X1 n=1 Tax=Musa acuminata AAA Group TaxID=214697 RepID=UPI0031DEB506